MNVLGIVLAVLAGLMILGLFLSVRVVKQYEQGVVLRLGKVLGAREPGCT